MNNPDSTRSAVTTGHPMRGSYCPCVTHLTVYKSGHSPGFIKPESQSPVRALSCHLSRLHLLGPGNLDKSAREGLRPMNFAIVYLDFSFWTWMKFPQSQYGNQPASASFVWSLSKKDIRLAFLSSEADSPFVISLFQLYPSTRRQPRQRHLALQMVTFSTNQIIRIRLNGRSHTSSVQCIKCQVDMTKNSFQNQLSLALEYSNGTTLERV